jgi:hypothetical protein
MYYNGCPVHDLESYSRLEFFETLDQVIKSTLEDFREYKTEAVYSIETQNYEEMCVGYYYYSHSISEIRFRFKDGSERRFKPHEYEAGKWQEMVE